MAAFPWLAGQLRGAGICPRLPDRPGASAVVRAATVGSRHHPCAASHPQGAWQAGPYGATGDVKMDGQGQAKSTGRSAPESRAPLATTKTRAGRR